MWEWTTRPTTPRNRSYGYSRKLKGLKVSDLCRQQGIAEATYYRWKSKYGGLEVSEAKRLRALEEENRRLKQLVADKELDILGLRAALSEKY